MLPETRDVVSTADELSNCTVAIDSTEERGDPLQDWEPTQSL